MDLKKPLTFDEQLDKLIVHGMIVADREKAKDILKRVNYYRFTGYVNVYTHIGFDDAEEELKRMEEFRKAQAEVEQKKEKTMSQKMFKVI